MELYLPSLVTLFGIIIVAAISWKTGAKRAKDEIAERLQEKLDKKQDIKVCEDWRNTCWKTCRARLEDIKKL